MATLQSQLTMRSNYSTSQSTLITIAILVLAFAMSLVSCKDNKVIAKIKQADKGDYGVHRLLITEVNPLFTVGDTIMFRIPGKYIAEPFVIVSVNKKS